MYTKITYSGTDFFFFPEFSHLTMFEQRHKIKLLFSASGLNRFQQFVRQQINNQMMWDQTGKQRGCLPWKKKKKKNNNNLFNVLCHHLLKDGKCTATVQAQHRSKPKWTSCAFIPVTQEKKVGPQCVFSRRVAASLVRDSRLYCACVLPMAQSHFFFFFNFDPPTLLKWHWITPWAFALQEIQPVVTKPVWLVRYDVGKNHEMVLPQYLYFSDQYLDGDVGIWQCFFVFCLLVWVYRNPPLCLKTNNWYNTMVCGQNWKTPLSEKILGFCLSLRRYSGKCPMTLDLKFSESEHVLQALHLFKSQDSEQVGVSMHNKEERVQFQLVKSRNGIEPFRVLLKKMDLDLRRTSTW